MKANYLLKNIGAMQSIHGLGIHGIRELKAEFWNLDSKALLDLALERNEGILTNTGALSCKTGEHTGRSPGDKFIVKDATTLQNVNWGSVNQPLTLENYTSLRYAQLDYLKGKELFVLDAFAGADPNYRIPIRVINENAWSNLFAKHLFIRPKSEELSNHLPQFTVIHTPNFAATPQVHGTRSGTFIIINFTEGLVLIGGTSYTGEMKKSIFSVLNYLYPLRNVLSMHCSANMSQDKKNTALFFGLSGTGKTTLSADPHRRLIGDDEHGWSDLGVFNFEGGCYAKCVNLSKEKEPQIWNAIRDQAILENVVVNPATGEPDYKDVSLTENTRAAYPVEYIENAVLDGLGDHPQNIVFLTCDAFGVMPPLAKLSPEQAMYHFLSGYTAKVAGTEKGMGSSPQTTFSTCFGSPFLPLNPGRYAELLGKKIKQYQVNCWLVNTGWIGGGYGLGKRIQLEYTRRMVEAAINGELKKVSFKPDPIFGLMIPEAVAGVPAEILQPKKQWQDGAAYDTAAQELAKRFVENFKKFEEQGVGVVEGGPRV